jgi:AraC-like DNA-binding protein
MEKAVRLLRDTTMPVKEVAYECGFDESNYFIHVFRQMYGTTPQQFRQTPGLKK